MNNGKRITSLLLILFLSFSIVSNVFAAGTAIKINIDGKEQTYDQPPVIINQSTLVPLRGIFETLGAVVSWNATTKTITATKGDTVIKLVLNQDSALVNGKTVKLAVKAQTINNRTMVPLRFVSEALGAKVVWDQSTSSVIINSEATIKLSIEEIVAQNDQRIVLVLTDDSLGSGIVIKDGFILTNYHVIKGSPSATIVDINNKKYQVEGIVVFDEEKDLAVLKVSQLMNISPVKIGSPTSSLKGQKIITIGNPEGLQNTVSEGIISGFRTDSGVNYVQITAPITHGSSGGALFNEKGEVIGVTTLGYNDGLLNFAVSIDHIKEWMQGVLANDYSKVAAGFPELATVFSQDNENEQILTELEEELNLPENLNISTSAGIIRIDHFEAFLSEDNRVQVIGVMNFEDYTTYYNQYDLVEADVEKWAKSIGDRLNELFPDDVVDFEVYFYDFVKLLNPRAKITDYFLEEEAEYYPAEDEYLITHWIIDIELSDNKYFDMQP